MFASALARNTAWMSVGQGLQFTLQAAYFAVIARTLGVQNYGAFVGVAALVAVLYPFGSFGRGNLLIKHVARDRTTFASMWGSALLATIISSSALVAIIISVARFVLPATVPLRLVIFVAISDIPGLCVIAISGQAFQAFEHLHWTAFINLCTSVCRLAAALLLVLVHRHPSALEWGYAYFISTAFTVTAALAIVTWRLGTPQLRMTSSVSEWREGLYFSVSLSAQTIYNNIDKAMLARFSTLAATGTYGAAYRLIDVGFSPVSALLYSAYPTFFRSGASGLASSLSYARRLMWRAMHYGIVVTVLLFAGASVVPMVLGPQYKDTAEALRWLAILPILKVVHYPLSDALSGAGYQGIRSVIQTAVAIFNVSVNLWIIPRYSWRGAAWSSIASDTLLAAAIALCSIMVSRHERMRFNALASDAT